MRALHHWRDGMRHGAGWVSVLLATLAMLVLVLLVGSTASACPTCKAALASQDGSGGDLVSGFFWSILFMMSMPFLILGSIGTYMYVLVRKARAAQAAQAAQRPAEAGPAVAVAAAPQETETIGV